jgi:hypothetical protein
MFLLCSYNRSLRKGKNNLIPRIGSIACHRWLSLTRRFRLARNTARKRSSPDVAAASLTIAFDGPGE